MNDEQLNKIIARLENLRSTLGWIGLWMLIIAMNTCHRG